MSWKKKRHRTGQKEIDQITSREYFDKEYELNKDLAKDSPLTKNDVI